MAVVCRSALLGSLAFGPGPTAAWRRRRSEAFSRLSQRDLWDLDRSSTRWNRITHNSWVIRRCCVVPSAHDLRDISSEKRRTSSSRLVYPMSSDACHCLGFPASPTYWCSVRPNCDLSRFIGLQCFGCIIYTPWVKKHLRNIFVITSANMNWF